MLDELCVNLIDSPGHVDFSPEVSAALRITDGCVVVVDAASGVKVQTQTVLKQSLQEAVKPVLVLNKLDRLFSELQLSKEEIYDRLWAVIDSVNNILQTYARDEMPPTLLNPMAGNVVFASGKQGWAFTLPQMAALYAKKNNKKVSDYMQVLWGDVYEHAEKKFSKKRLSGGREGERGFCKYVLEPLIGAYEALKGEPKWNDLRKWMEPLGVEVQENKHKTLAQLFPAADALIEVIRLHLPSPLQAQEYRLRSIYSGPQEGLLFDALSKCDPEGPLCIYISKLVEAGGKGFMALGRVFSGTLTRNQKVNIVPAKYDSSIWDQPQPDLHLNVAVQSIAAPKGVDFESLDLCHAGQIVCLGGVEKFINRTATIFDAKTPLKEVHPINEMKFSVSAVVSVSVKPSKASDLPSFQSGLQKLQKTDSLVKIQYDSATQETTLAGCGELHLEIVVQDLKKHARNINLIVGDPVVSLRETVVAPSKEAALAKSSNKHNRVYSSSFPLHEELVACMVEQRVPADARERSVLLNEHSEWEIDAKTPKKLWCFGGSAMEAEVGPNALVDDTKAVDYLNEAQNFFVTSFRKFCQNGPLCGEPVHGVGLKVVDVKLHSDKAHRGAGELLEACRRSYSGAMLSGEPRLMEPVLLASIEVPFEHVSTLYNFISKRRGKVISEARNEHNPLVLVTAHIPALACKHFDQELKAATSGQGFPILEFSHWEVIDSDPLEAGSFANKLLVETRKRKGMSLEVSAAQFIDKL